MIWKPATSGIKQLGIENQLIDKMNYQQPNYDPNQEQSPDSRHEKINTIWKIVMTLYALGTLGLVFWWEADDSGLCVIVREWQGYLMTDEYYPALDIMLAWVMLLIPLFVVKFLVEKMTGVKLDNYKR